MTPELTPEPEAPGPCPHLEFRATVTVNRLEDTGRFSADVRVECLGCGSPFRWMGVPAGLSPYEPRVSIDGLELRAPIEPEGTPTLAASASFTVPPLPPTAKEGN